jgi:ferritin-like metal-binding protein YciE
MLNNNNKEVFLNLLSNIWHGNERVTKAFQELSQFVNDEGMRDSLQARIFVSTKIQGTLDECFRVLGEQPGKPNTRLIDTFIEDARKEVAEIKAPAGKNLYVAAKISQLIHMRIGEYVALIAAADMTGNYAVGVLLESCLADKLALAERTKRMVLRIVEEKVATRAAA